MKCAGSERRGVWPRKLIVPAPGPGRWRQSRYALNYREIRFDKLHQMVTDAAAKW